MKKLLFLGVLLAGFGVASTASAQITGTAHDFNGSFGLTEICQPCHTPHDADTTVTISPLWNHALASNAGYTVYTSTTLTATMGQPTGISNLCLSCHDGTVAIDSFGGVVGTTSLVATDAGYVGKNLTTEHPIAFTYNTALATADGGLHDPVTTSALGGTITTAMLFGGSLECASCHDVHGTANPNMLRLSNTGSALCLTCHNK